jgi:serine/threonine protein kinase
MEAAAAHCARCDVGKHACCGVCAHAHPPAGVCARAGRGSHRAQGIHYLHEHELLHRDVKTENLLVDDTWRCVVCDFGFARKRGTAMTICGTDEFMAPEVIWGEEYGFSADIFSFGVVLAEVITRRKPGKDGFLERQPRNKFEVSQEQIRCVRCAFRGRAERGPPPPRLAERWRPQTARRPSSSSCRSACPRTPRTGLSQVSFLIG